MVVPFDFTIPLIAFTRGSLSTTLAGAQLVPLYCSTWLREGKVAETAVPFNLSTDMAGKLPLISPPNVGILLTLLLKVFQSPLVSKPSWPLLAFWKLMIVPVPFTALLPPDMETTAGLLVVKFAVVPPGNGAGAQLVPDRKSVV